MLFTSIEFLLFCLITFIVYYSVKKEKLQLTILLSASFIFYAWNYPVLVLLLLFSVIINSIVSYRILYAIDVNKCKLYAVLGVVANLLLLSFFKYSPLFGRSFFSNNSSIGDFLLSIPLPIGISFFTFQGISLVVDTFKQNKVSTYSLPKADSFRQHLLHSSLFISFFPQLVAGPIVKAQDFLPQIQPKLFREIDWETCFRILVQGYFLKMVIADNIKDHTLWMVYPYFEAKSGLMLLTMLFGYSIQIFADFAGYSLIAIGIAGLFGYRLNDNFLFPYISTSLSEFWQRWHISLSSFLKEYLYIPLGGNRKGQFRTYINLLVTMLLGGIWHGAAWSYLVWGGYHGLMLALERVLKDKVSSSFFEYTFMKFIRGTIVFTIVTFGWLLFKLPNFQHAIGYIKSMFFNPFFISNFNLVANPNAKSVLLIAFFALPVILYHLLYLLKVDKKNPLWEQGKVLVYAMMLFLIITNSGTATAFIYFQF